MPCAIGFPPEASRGVSPRVHTTTSPPSAATRRGSLAARNRCNLCDAVSHALLLAGGVMHMFLQGMVAAVVVAWLVVLPRENKDE